MLDPRRLARSVACLAAAAALTCAAPPRGHAGPVILGGDDLPLHGCYVSNTNQQGWLYIQKALDRMFQGGCITRPNDGTVAALGVYSEGSNPPTGNCASGASGGSAIHYTAGVALGKTITYWNGASGPGSIAAFFTALQSNSIQPAVIWICSGLGDLGNELDLAELNVINANATVLANFVNGGGGLMAHTSVPDFANYPATYNGWLSTLIPGLTEVGGCNSTGAVLTPAGNAAFPGLQNSDIDGTAGPCHSYFAGALGSLQALAIDGQSPPQPFIIGGDCSTVICDQCTTVPDTCCAGRPTMSGVEAPTFSNNLMVGTREANGSNPFAVTIFDLGSTPPSPLEDKNWSTILRFNGPLGSWTQAALGTVFGLTLDDTGNIFVTHSSCYNTDAVATLPGGGPGGVYRIDATTGAMSAFAVLPNLPDGSVPPGSDLPGLGNIAFDCAHKQFFVTNHEDGKIYRIQPGPNASPGTVVQTFDPLLPDNGLPGWAPRGELLWGVQVHAGRVFYSVWVEDVSAPNASKQNEIRSVALLPGGAIDPASDQHEVWVPSYPGQSWSNPVSDISFDASGKLLLAERGIAGLTFASPHQARVLEYKCLGSCWIPGNSYQVGPPGPGTDAAGGVDYDRFAFTFDRVGRVWASADLMHNMGPYTDILSGYQGFRPTGGSHLNSVLVDSDGSPVAGEPMSIGDVELAGCSGPTGTVCGYKFRDLDKDGVLDSGEQLLGGWTIQLFGPGGSFTTTTDVNGQYCFYNVPVGSYTLTEQAQAGWIQSAPPGGSHAVVVTANSNTTGLAFANYQCNVIGGGCATPPTTMVAWWPFDEPVSSTTAIDITHQFPPRNVAQLLPGATLATGIVNNALCVSGEFDGAKVPNATSTGLAFGAGPLAMDAWILPNNSASSWRSIVEKRRLVSTSPYRTQGFAVYMQGNQLRLELGNGVTVQNVPGPTVFPATWNHVAVSVSRSPAAGRWFLNGLHDPTYDFVPLAGSLTNAVDLYVGNVSPSFGVGVMEGCLDELELLNAPLTDAVVYAVYLAGLYGKCRDIVRMPESVSICQSQTSVPYCFSFTNASASTVTYSWALAGLPAGPGCTVAGPVSFTPASGSVTLAPGATSSSICVTIARPAGLTAQNATSCFQMQVLNDSTGACSVQQGKIRADNTCWCVTTPPGPVAVPGRLAAGIVGIPIVWPVANPCGGIAFPFQVTARWERGDLPDPQLVSLNGLPPGEPYAGTFTLAPGQTEGEIAALVSVPGGHDFATFYEIVLDADLDGDGLMERVGGTCITTTYDTVAVDVPGGRPAPIVLDLRGDPNPFTSGATVTFALPRGGDVDLSIYDAGGRLVRRLVRGALAAGSHRYDWDGRNQRGREAPMGVYFLRLRSAGGEKQIKLVRLH